MTHYPEHLKKVIEVLKRFPGVGNKSAERFAFDLLNWKPAHLQEMAETISSIPHHLHNCNICGCLKEKTECRYCLRNDHDTLCVVASAKDVFAIESTREFRGTYHVLGGLLSPLEGIGPDQLRIEHLKKRLENIQELVIALDSTLEGDTTALYLKKILADHPVKISRLAFGLPMGSSLDYVDGGTLARAFAGRDNF